MQSLFTAEDAEDTEDTAAFPAWEYLPDGAPAGNAIDARPCVSVPLW